MRKTLLSIAIGMAFATPISSFAQDTTEVKDSGPKLEKIIITGQRREERLEDAAIAVSAKTGEDIVNAGITQTSDLSRIFPALQINSTGAGGASIFIRGVGTLQGDAFGENPNAFNFDGVYIARPTAPVGSMYDLKRVEVLKGPQGTLYGRNATGGAINVLPERPTLDDEISGNFIVDLGNYEKKQFQGAINIPLTDTMAFRLAGQVIDRDGYNSDGTSDEKGEALRASLLIQPNDELSIALVADYYHQGGKGAGSVLMPGGSLMRH